MLGVKIGEKHSYDDFGLILSSKVISPPKPQLNLVKVPLRDGSIDLTESLTDDVKYYDRDITITFTMVDPFNMHSTKMSQLENYLHGRRMKIIFDDDCSYYYIGRSAVDKVKSNKSMKTIEVKCTVEPYKYAVLSSADEWEWDVFDFEEGYITEASEVVIDGTATISIYGNRKRVCPTITSDSSMTLTHNGTKYNISAGTQKLYELILDEGLNELTFTGTGIVTVDYIGGSL